MRIVFISTMAGVPWGGSEELWYEAALRLHQEGHEVSASLIWWPQLSPKVLALQKLGIKVFLRKQSFHQSLPVRTWHKAKRKLGWQDGAAKWLRKRKPDLTVISQGGNSDGIEWMSFCRDEGLPFVSIVQCNWEAWWPSDGARGAMASAYRSAAKVFFICRPNLELLEYQIGEFLPNAEIVWNPFHAPKGPTPNWPMGDAIWRLACVGRLEPVQKGQDMMIEVLARTSWRDRPIELNLYGAGPCEQSLRLMADRFQLKNIHFHGHVTNLESIWETNHLLVLPSRYEAMPIVVMEAMWCARPTLVTEVGRTAEMCLDNETGFLAQAPTVNHLEQALERAWNRRHDWQNMGKLARARAEAIIPKDLIGDFCSHLTACVKKQKNEIEK